MSLANFLQALEKGASIPHVSDFLSDILLSLVFIWEVGIEVEGEFT
jgi:hypothetical protein